MSTSNNSTNSNQQTLADSGANERPPMLEKGNYIPWESRFRRFLDNKLEDGERMWNSIQNGPYQRPMVVDPTNPTVPILEPLSKMTEGNMKQYIADERIKRLMHGSEIPTHVRHSRLMDEFDKFAAKEGEYLDSVHERLTTLVNIMDRNNVRPILVAINIKFLNCLQPEWSKYVIMVRHNQTGSAVSYDVLYDSLVQFEPHVLASRAKKAAKNHDPLAFIAHSNASLSHSHANSSYSPQPYYVAHPPSVIDYDDEYQGELQGDSQEDKLTTAMMNQVVVQDGRVDIQTKNAGYGGNVNKNIGRNRTQGFNTGNACNESNQIIQEQMLLAMKDEAGSNLSNEENDFMLDTSYGEDLEELTATVHASSKVHEQVSHGKRQTIIQTTDDDQIDSNIIFDGLFVENNVATLCVAVGRKQKHELLKVELEKSSSDSRDIQANLLKRIKIIENDFQRSQAQSIDFELKVQHQKEKMDCDVSWKAKLSTLHDENVLLKHQHQNENNEMIENINQKTYDYADVQAQNQDLLMIIFELKSKLRTIEKGKHLNTKFDKSETLGQLLCVTPFNKNLAIMAKNVSNTKVTSDRPNPVTS
ncbi:hypothetical protein Tco_1377828 [Tanacetum coccineum]